MSTPRRAAFLPLRRLLLSLGTLAGMAGLLYGGWVFLHRGEAPDLPEVALENAEPAVAAAIEQARQRVRQEPRSASAWGALGKVLLAHGCGAPAVACFARAEELDGREPRWPYLRAVALACREEGGAVCRPRLAAHEAAAATACLRRASDRCEERAPAMTAPRLLLAEHLLETGELDEAAQHLEIVAARQPDNPRLQFDLGVLAFRRNDLTGAVAHLERAAAEPVARQKACAQLAMIFHRLGRPAQAAEYSEQARQAPVEAWEDPYVAEYERLNVSRQQRLQRVQDLEAGGNFAEAVTVLSDLAAESRHDVVQFAVGSNLAKQGRFEEAEQVLSRLAAAQPDNAAVHHTLGLVCFFQGERLRGAAGSPPEAGREKFRAAAGSLRRALELTPAAGASHVYLGRTLLRLGEPKEGLAHLRQAVLIRPEAAFTHLSLADALAELGQAAEARRCLEQAEKLADARDSSLALHLQRLRAILKDK